MIAAWSDWLMPVAWLEMWPLLCPGCIDGVEDGGEGDVQARSGHVGWACNSPANLPQSVLATPQREVIGHCVLIPVGWPAVVARKDDYGRLPHLFLTQCRHDLPYPRVHCHCHCAHSLSRPTPPYLALADPQERCWCLERPVHCLVGEVDELRLTWITLLDQPNGT